MAVLVARRTGGLSANRLGGAHPSDVLVGAAAGCLAAIFFLKVGWLPVWFDRWEQR